MEIDFCPLDFASVSAQNDRILNTHPSESHGRRKKAVDVSFCFVFANIAAFMADRAHQDQDRCRCRCADSMENDYFVQSFMTFGCAMAINVALLFGRFIVFHISQRRDRPQATEVKIAHVAGADKFQTFSHIFDISTVGCLRCRDEQ